MRTEAKAELPLPVYACKNTYVLRAIDTYIQAVQANPRFIFSNQGKNAISKGVEVSNVYFTETKYKLTYYGLHYD